MSGLGLTTNTSLRSFEWELTKQIPDSRYWIVLLNVGIVVDDDGGVDFNNSLLP